MEVRGVEIDIQIQINEVNSYPHDDEINTLRYQRHMNESRWETSIDRFSRVDPLIENFCTVLEKNLPSGDWHSHLFPRFGAVPVSYVVTFYINGFPFILQKEDCRFKLMGKIMTKKDALITIAKTAMYAGTSKKDGSSVYLFFNKYMETPNLIKRAMEERIEYYFNHVTYVKKSVGLDLDTLEDIYETRPYHKREKVLLNVQKISNKRYALEISDNVWGEMSEKDMLAFIKIYNGERKNRRSKWWNISPKYLWKYTMGNYPSESQLNTMIQFLLHNRRDKIVVDKSLELVRSLEKFDNIRVRRHGSQLKVIVKGKEAYWFIFGEIKNENEGNLQDVSTVMITHLQNPENNENYWRAKKINDNFYSKYGGVDVCIDNLMGGSSIGDQVYARAMLCLNDSESRKIINTIDNKLSSKTALMIEDFESYENVWEEE
tara:strand:+ start:295 stop:1590 length:1296 start_codon:yes stop_codon:yes gene_type:complete